MDTDSDLLTAQEDFLYPYVNNDKEYGLFEDIVESYHLDSQIKDDFQCDPDCYTQTSQLTKDDQPNICTHDYLNEENALSFTDDTDMQCDYSISAHTSDIPNTNDNHTSCTPTHTAVHFQ